MIYGAIFWDNKPSTDLNVIVEKSPSFPVPARKKEVISVPGRNGDIVISQDAYENVTQEYELAIAGPALPSAVRAVMEWLLRPAGYARLEDSFNPEVFRMAYFNASNAIENNFHVLGRAKVSFSCKPQRYLRIGERAITAVNGIKLKNPSVYTAKPLIVVQGTDEGVLTVGDVEIEISDFGTGGEIDIDCETMSAYYGAANLNNLITLTDGVFPSLPEGETQISWTGGITAVEITPRWWIL